MLPQNASFYSIPTIAGSPSNALAGATVLFVAVRLGVFTCRRRAAKQGVTYPHFSRSRTRLRPGSAGLRLADAG
jgi:hypothetical protein